MLLLRSPPGKNGVAEKIHLKEQSVKYNRYTEDDIVPGYDERFIGYDNNSPSAANSAMFDGEANVKPLDLVP